MVCKDCLIFRREYEETRARQSNLHIDAARFLGRKVDDVAVVERWTESLNDVGDWLDCKWRKLVAIGDMECREEKCWLCDLTHA